MEAFIYSGSVDALISGGRMHFLFPAKCFSRFVSPASRFFLHRFEVFILSSFLQFRPESPN